MGIELRETLETIKNIIKFHQEHNHRDDFAWLMDDLLIAMQTNGKAIA